MIEDVPLRRTKSRLVISADSYYWNLWNMFTLMQAMGLIRWVPNPRLIRESASNIMQRQWERTSE